MINKLKLAHIQTDGLQARVSTDAGTVEEYAESMQAGKMFPPMVVFHHAGEYFLADGFHRLQAYLKLGVEEVSVNVMDGDRNAAMWYAIAANKTHGLKRTNADKRKAVFLALEINSGMSDRAIAEHVGVDHKTVSSLRTSNIQKTSTGEIPQLQVIDNQRLDILEPAKRVGIDGKTRQLPSRPAPKPKGPLDSIGREIPDGIVSLWNQAAEMRGYITAISRLRGEIRRAQEEQSAVFAEVNVNLVHSELNNLFTHLAVLEPYAVCPTCQGKIPKGCRLCRERGFISEHRWKTAVPDETKAIILASIEK